MFNLKDAASVLDVNMNLSTLIVLCGMLAVSYLSMRKVGGFVCENGKKWLTTFPAAFSTAAVLFLSGLGSVGYGLGELNSGPDKKKDVALSTEQLMKLANEKDMKLDHLKEVLEYAKWKERQNNSVKESVDSKKVALLNVTLTSLDNKDTTKVVADDSSNNPSISADEPNKRLGYFSLLGGLASAIMGVVICICKLNKPV